LQIQYSIACPNRPMLTQRYSIGMI
jgi:hypothetical protein